MNDFSNYPRFTEYFGKNILSIDFGTKVIGSAMFRPGRDPFPYSFQKIIYKSHEDSIKKIQTIVRDEDVEVIVLGVPFYVDGKESNNTLFVRSFGEVLKAELNGLTFLEQDETLTTKAAEDRMKNSAEFNFKVDPTKIDCLSAVIILEDFIRN